jgi:hypothetical protein
MVDAATGSQTQETTPHPPHPRAALRPCSNEARIATSVAVGRTTSTSSSPASGASALSSRGATTPNNVEGEPTTTTAT